MEFKEPRSEPELQLMCECVAESQVDPKVPNSGPEFFTNVAKRYNTAYMRRAFQSDVSIRAPTTGPLIKKITDAAGKNQYRQTMNKSLDRPLPGSSSSSTGGGVGGGGGGGVGLGFGVIALLLGFLAVPPPPEPVDLLR